MPNAFPRYQEFPLNILSEKTIACLEALAAEKGVDLQTAITAILGPRDYPSVRAQ
jgi:hypothetical protein